MKDNYPKPINCTTREATSRISRMCLPSDVAYRSPEGDVLMVLGSGAVAKPPLSHQMIHDMSMEHLGVPSSELFRVHELPDRDPNEVLEPVSPLRGYMVYVIRK